MAKKVLFIDRDGTLIVEPPVTFQVDTLEQLRFLPGVIQYLAKISQEMSYELVLVTNQDGLGTAGYPEAQFLVIQNKILQIFSDEGIRFSAIHIDRSYPHQNLPTRKPGIGLLTHYLQGDYDLANSYVIGDRATDIQLANNLGCQSIFIHNYEEPDQLAQKASLLAKNWAEIYLYLKNQHRRAHYKRITTETKIEIDLWLDGSGQYAIDTGLGFFNHMLEQLARHSSTDISIKVKGDLHIDEHHTIEDVGIALGEAFAEALGRKAGISRYGFSLPMDDVLAQAAIDFSGRPWLVWDVAFVRERVGDLPTEMVHHFFKSFSDGARANLNLKAEGSNEHHKIEALFKALARSIKMAIAIEAGNTSIPSTKGLL
jgi:imidazoleglycerol-phosphate dehydratase / histidinol-phosphatase